MTSHSDTQVPVDFDASGADADDGVIAHTDDVLDKLIEAAAQLVAEIHYKAEVLGVDPSRLLPSLDALEDALHPTFRDDERVQLYTRGTGRVWPKGAYMRRGRILKDGHTERSYLVVIDEPLGEDRVINARSIDMRAIPES